MAAAAPKTIQELEAQINTIRQEIEQRELAPLEAITLVLRDPAFAAAVEIIQENMELLSGQRQQQASNLLTVLGIVPGFLEKEADEITARLAPPPSPLLPLAPPAPAPAE